MHRNLRLQTADNGRWSDPCRWRSAAADTARMVRPIKGGESALRLRRSARRTHAAPSRADRSGASPVSPQSGTPAGTARDAVTTPTSAAAPPVAPLIRSLADQAITRLRAGNAPWPPRAVDARLDALSPPLRAVVEVLVQAHSEWSALADPTALLPMVAVLEQVGMLTPQQLWACLQTASYAPDNPETLVTVRRLCAHPLGRKVAVWIETQIATSLDSDPAAAAEWVKLWYALPLIKRSEASSMSFLRQQFAEYWVKYLAHAKEGTPGLRRCLGLAELLFARGWGRQLRNHVLSMAKPNAEQLSLAVHVLARLPSAKVSDPFLTKIVQDPGAPSDLKALAAVSLHDEAAAARALLPYLQPALRVPDNVAQADQTWTVDETWRCFAVVKALQRRWLPSQHQTLMQQLAPLLHHANEWLASLAAQVWLQRQSLGDEDHRSEALAALQRSLACSEREYSENGRDPHLDDLRRPAVEILGRYGATESVPLLRAMLMRPGSLNRALWPSLATALVQLGDLEWTTALLLERLHVPPDVLSSFQSQENLDQAVKALCAVVRAALPSEAQRRVAAAATCIRTAFRAVPRGALARARGFVNRGRRQRRGIGPMGDPFDGGSQRVYAAQADVRRIDWSATERLDDAAKAMGIVVERQTGASGSRPTLIVIDPAIFAGCTPRAVALLAGTIAQHTVAAGDPVGLYIGGSSATRRFLPPGMAPHQLERILQELLTYDAPTNATLSSPAAVLEQPVVRQYLRPGTRVYCVADFIAGDPAQLARLDTSLRARGAEWQPIAVRRHLPVPQPILECGPTRWRAETSVTEAVVFQVHDRHRDTVDRALETMGAALVDLTSIAAEAIPDATIDAVWGRDGIPTPTPLVAIQVVAEQLYRGETAEPADLAARIAAARGNRDAWHILLREALESGWSTPLTYAVETLEAAGRVDDFRHRVFFGARAPLAQQTLLQEHADLLRACDTIASILAMAEGAVAQHAATAPPPAPVSRWMPLRRWWGAHFGTGTIPTAAANQPDGGGASDAVTAAAPSRVAAPEAIRPGDSGVARSVGEGDEMRWVKVQPAPQGAGRYLRQRLGVVIDGATLQPHPALSPTTLTIAGGRQHHGTLRPGVPADPRRLQSVGGSSVTLAGGRVHFSTNDEASVHPSLGQPIAALAAQVPESYDDRLFTALTTGPTFTDLESVAPGFAALARRVVDEARALPLREALRCLQRVVAEESGLAYRSYQGDPIAEPLWKAWCARADRGEASLLDGVRLTMTAGGGQCQEFALLGLMLLRLAGIPSAVGSGWRIRPDGGVYGTAHAWVEVILPQGNGRWMGLPVEMAPPMVAEASLSAWLQPVADASVSDSHAPLPSDTAAVETEGTPENSVEIATEVEPPAAPAATPPASIASRATDALPERVSVTSQVASPPTPAARARAARVAVTTRGIAQLWAAGTAAERGAVREAFSALHLWLRPDEKSEALQHFLNAPDGVERFINLNARARDEEIGPSWHLPNDLSALLDVAASAAHPNSVRTTARLDQWLTGVERYFGW